MDARQRQNQPVEHILESLSNRMLDLDSLAEERERRFREFSIEKTHSFVEEMKNINTKRKTTGDVKLLHSWMTEHLGDARKAEFIPPIELDSILARFFLSIRKPDLTEYEPESIKSKQLSISRYLKDRKYKYDIMSDVQFSHSRQCVFSKKKKLKQEGLGNKRRKADPFTEAEIQQMYMAGVLGRENPEALMNSMWLNNTTHFGLRGRQEHQTLLWGDVELERTSDGIEFLVFNERATKTRNGASGSTRMFPPKMFEQRGDPYCPVQLYKTYADKRPASMNLPEKPFYLGINRSRKPESPWYIACGMGKNTIGDIAKRMSEKAGLSGRFTNHSGRKTAVTTLVNEDIPINQIMQLTGHKNVKSINDYSTASIRKQQEMSAILSSISKPKSTLENTLQAIENYENQPPARASHPGDNDNNIANIANAQLQPVPNINVTETRAETGTAADNNVNLPLISSPGGSLSVQFTENTLQRFNPQSMFQGCTFHAPISITIAK